MVVGVGVILDVKLIVGVWDSDGKHILYSILYSLGLAAVAKEFEL